VAYIYCLQHDSVCHLENKIFFPDPLFDLNTNKLALYRLGDRLFFFLNSLHLLFKFGGVSFVPEHITHLELPPCHLNGRHTQFGEKIFDHSHLDVCHYPHLPFYLE
jgi:hypothetical protein